MSSDLFFILIATAGAFLAAAILYSGWLLIGLRMKLYLVSKDSPFVEQSLIPITSEARKRSFASLWKGLWHEDIEFSLGDFDGHLHSFKVDYHLRKRFLVTLTEPSPTTKLKGKPMTVGVPVRLRSGDQFELGGRTFHALVTPNLQREQRTFAKAEPRLPRSRKSKQRNRRAARTA